METYFVGSERLIRDLKAVWPPDRREMEAHFHLNGGGQMTEVFLPFIYEKIATAVWFPVSCTVKDLWDQMPVDGWCNNLDRSFYVIWVTILVAAPMLKLESLLNSSDHKIMDSC